MATVGSTGSRHWPPDREVPSPLGHYFNDGEQSRLLDEDYQAGRNVGTELISVIAAAIVAGLIALFCIVLFT